MKTKAFRMAEELSREVNIAAATGGITVQDWLTRAVEEQLTCPWQHRETCRECEATKCKEGKA